MGLRGNPGLPHAENGDLESAFDRLVRLGCQVFPDTCGNGNLNDVVKSQSRFVRGIKIVAKTVVKDISVFSQAESRSVLVLQFVALPVHLGMRHREYQYSTGLQDSLKLFHGPEQFRQVFERLCAIDAIKRSVGERKSTLQIRCLKLRTRTSLCRHRQHWLGEIDPYNTSTGLKELQRVLTSAATGIKNSFPFPGSHQPKHVRMLQGYMRVRVAVVGDGPSIVCSSCASIHCPSLATSVMTICNQMCGDTQ